MTEMKRAIFLYDFQRMSQEEFISSEEVLNANAPSAGTKLKADNNKEGIEMPAESSKVVKYQACPECTWNQITEVLFHSHVSQFDQLVKMITVIGQHFETHTNVAVVVLGDSSNVWRRVKPNWKR